MGAAKSARALDALIAADRFPNRSQAIEAALADKIDRLKHIRLAREAAMPDPRQEQAEADEGLNEVIA